MKKYHYADWFCYMGIGLIITACSSSKETKDEPVFKVRTETVRDSRHAQSFNYIGVVEEKESTELSFINAGTIESVNVEEGDHVSKGQILSTINTSSAEYMLKAAEASLQQAQDAYNRLKELHDNESLPEIKMVEITTKLQQAQSSYDVALKAYNDCFIRAPFSGVISDKQLSKGTSAIPGRPVFTLVDISQVKVKVSVPETEISRISSTDSAVVQVPALENDTFNGFKIEKGVAANTITHTYNIYVKINNTDNRLLPGMVCNVEILRQGMQPAITIPIQALQKSTSDEYFVWKAEQGKAEKCNVKVGECTGNRIIITSGLVNNDRIISEGYQKISENSKITF